MGVERVTGGGGERCEVAVQISYIFVLADVMNEAQGRFQKQKVDCQHNCYIFWKSLRIPPELMNGGICVQKPKQQHFREIPIQNQSSMANGIPFAEQCNNKAM